MVSIRYTATNTLENSELFTCRICNFRDSAKATGTGTGTAKAKWFHGAAKDAAHDGAFISAIDTSRRLIRDATCPRCKRRNGSLQGRQVKYLVVAFILAVAAAGVPLVLSELLDEARWPAVLSVLPMLMLVLAIVLLRGRMQQEDESVVFASTGAPEFGPLPSARMWLAVGAAPFLGLSLTGASAVLMKPTEAVRAATAAAPVVVAPAPAAPTIDPERDESMRAGVLNTCLDGKESEELKAQCACAAEAFLRESATETLRELRVAGWNRDSLAALEVARRGCDAPR
jgi:hypothetical protein